jgi:hypothetical protein
MRFLFHAMLGLSIGVVGSGLVYGAVARERVVHAGARGHVARQIARAVPARVPVEMTLPPPLPMFPRFGEPVAPGATMAWHLLEGTDGAVVELSPRPTFEPDTTRRLEVDGETVKLPAGLGPGIWYWHLRARQGEITGERATATWMIDVMAPAGDPGWG